MFKQEKPTGPITYRIEKGADVWPSLRKILDLFDFDLRRRKIDLQILWPICKDQARDLDHAKAAFAIHAFNDPAWQRLSHEEIKRIIDELK